MALHSPPLGGFDVIVTAGAESVVIRPRGELDLATSGRLAAALQSTDAAALVIVLDLSGLTFIDASGLRVLIDAKQALADRLALLPGPPTVQRLFALTRTDHVLGFAPGPGEDDARAAAENMSYMRELWEAYRAGGARALADRLPPTTAPGGDRSAWGASELGAFWAHTVAPVPDPSYHVQTVGSSVLVSTAPSRPAEGASVAWSLYMFKGRTFIRALTLAL
jgi:anti-sigma B factor antagonist